MNTVHFSLLLNYELDYDDVSHLWALPVEVRKAELFRIIMESRPTNDTLQDFELANFQAALGKAFWERRKAELERNRAIAEANAIPALCEQ